MLNSRTAKTASSAVVQLIIYIMSKTSMFSNFQDRKGNYELVKVLNAIKEGKFDKEITQLREADSEEEKDRIKNSLLAFTPSAYPLH